MVSSLHSFVVTLLILSTTGFLPLFVYGKGGFSVDLIHGDPSKSVLFDSSSTPFSRLKAASESSFARAIYFGNSLQNIPSSFAPSPSSTDSFYSEIIRSNLTFAYFMRFYIGSPAKEIIAVPDTGNDLTWIQCKPCDQCYPQTTPLFDPQASSTYREISCHAESCSALPKNKCGPKSQCDYYHHYGDGSFVDGFLATETLSFESSNGGRRVPIPSTMFGCTHRSNGTFDASGAGLVGLGAGKLSLIRQLGSAIENRFSYCLASFSSNSTSGRLNFGSDAVVSGPGSVTTPIIPAIPETFYFLSLDQISVDGQGSVLVNPTMKAAANVSRGNIIIDSVTAYTFIDDETVQSVASKVASSVSFPQVADPEGFFSLCFNISGEEIELPDITFHFSGDAPVVLHPPNAFVFVSSNTVCLALVSSDSMGVNIFGNIAQQNRPVNGSDSGRIGVDPYPIQINFGSGQGSDRVGVDPYPIHDPYQIGFSDRVFGSIHLFFKNKNN